MDSEPRFATKRDPTRDTLGPEVRSIMTKLGYKVMPWQELVTDIKYEIDDDGTLVYAESIEVVPRQAGKTALALGEQVHRATSMQRRLHLPQRTLYLAQKGLDAKNKLIEEHLPILEASPFNALFTAIRETGNQGIKWKNGSYHHLAAPTAKAGHGGSIDLVQIDEAFVHQDDTIEQGVKPTMITRKSAQMCIKSAAGTEKSFYLKGKVEMGREMVRQGVQDDVCYFEWSADEDEDDLEDPELWARIHPAVGHTISIKTLKSFRRTMKEEEFNRAFLGIFSKKARPRVVAADKWEHCADPTQVPGDPISFALDVSPDRGYACVSASGRSEDGRIVVEILKHESGTGWVVDYVHRLLSANAGSTFSFDPGSSAGALVPDFNRKRVPYQPLTTADVAQSAGFLVDKINQRKLVHRNEALLNIALAGATQRKIGDKWGWGRQSGVDITPLVSVSLAAWSLETAPEATKFKMGMIV